MFYLFISGIDNVQSPSYARQDASVFANPQPADKYVKVLRPSNFRDASVIRNNTFYYN